MKTMAPTNGVPSWNQVRARLSLRPAVLMAAHVAPIWFILDGHELVFTTGRDSVKGRNMRQDPRVMLSVDDELPPFAFVLIEVCPFFASLWWRSCCPGLPGSQNDTWEQSRPELTEDVMPRRASY